MSGDNIIRIRTPLTHEAARGLHIGERVLLSGTILAARDAAHKRLVETLDRGEPLPTALQNQIIYYVGPSPAKPGQAIGSAGPTTAGRMDAYTPRLLEQGVTGMIGKGRVLRRHGRGRRIALAPNSPLRSAGISGTRA